MADEETKDETTEETEAPAAPELEAEPVTEAEAPAAAEPAAEETPAEESAPDTEPTADADSAKPEAPAEAAAQAPAQPEPKKKGKRLPRAQRPQKTRPARVRSTERKPISREPKPEHDRGRRQERRGVVVSDAMDKTIVVKVEAIRSHPKYKKVIRRSIKFHAHDEQNAAHVGDVVRIVETRPLSKTKHWRLAEIVEVAK
jgi:small subunit ribosomal protein S17